ncbi:MAG: hypothetical protein JW832_01605 [Deltaproteobacteria bacterium]|nr:hypothetical protein [Deltaproteobacteria bacterium]
MKHTIRILSITCVLFCAVALAACSDEKTVSSPQGDITVKETSKGIEVKSKDSSMSMESDKKSGHIKVKNQDGNNIEMTYAADKLVEGFPDDIPIYSPAAIKTSQIMSGEHAIATLSTTSRPEAVQTFYKSALPRTGWAIENEMAMNGMIMLQGKKADTNLTIQISKQADETTITIAKTDEEK